MELTIVLPDIHDQLGNKKSVKAKAIHPALKCAETVIREYQPDRVLYLGDITDMSCLSRFDRDKRGLMEGRRYQREIDAVNYLLDRHYYLSQDAEFIYMEGNHEDRVPRYLEYHPEMIGKIDYAKDVKLQERHIEFIRYNNTYKIGHALFMHGFDASIHHSMRMARTYPKSLFYAHTHDVQMTGFVSPIDMKEVRIATSLGCLCNLNPSWLRNKPNKWMHAFGMLWTKDNGEFQMDIKFVIRGTTIINGKEIG